jgi:hypothetical protein
VSEVAVPLNAVECELLAECEVVIERGMGVFIEVGTALMNVRDNRLYRAGFATFEDYCSERWTLSIPYANQLINAARVVETITDAVASEIHIPATESQARELAPLLDDPEELREVWDEAVERGNGAPTAAVIRAVREEREAAAPEFSARDEVADAMERHLPPDEPWRAWRAGYLADIHAGYRVMSRQTVGEVVERGDERCVEELYRLAIELTRYAGQVRAGRLTSYGDNVVPMRSAK